MQLARSWNARSCRCNINYAPKTYMRSSISLPQLVSIPISGIWAQTTAKPTSKAARKLFAPSTFARVYTGFTKGSQALAASPQGTYMASDMLAMSSGGADAASTALWATCAIMFVGAILTGLPALAGSSDQPQPLSSPSGYTLSAVLRAPVDTEDHHTCSLHLEDRSDLDPTPQPVADSADEGQISAGMVTAPSPEAAAPATDAGIEANTIDDVDSVVGALPPPPSLRPTPSSVLRGISMAPMHRSSSHDLCKPDPRAELQESTIALATLGDGGSVRMGGALVSGHAAKWLSELPPPAASSGDVVVPEPIEELPPLEPQISVASLPDSNEDQQRPLSPSSVATAAAVVAATGPAARDSLKDLLQEIEAEGKVKKGE